MRTRADRRGLRCLALVSGLCASPLVAQPPITVSPADGVDPIGAAVRRAPGGSTIRVLAGTYAEPTIVIHRPVRLVAEPGAVLDGRGDNALIEIRADDVTVSGFELRDVATSFVADRAALRVVNASGCVISDNTFERTFFGIYLEKARNCRIERNRLNGTGDRETTAGNGIHAWNSRDLVIVGNEVRGHRDGIYFEFVRASRVSGNRSESNHRYGLHFMFSDSCAYTGNDFVSNGAGVAVMYARAVDMRDNRFERNRGSASYGLLLKDIRDSRIVANRFLDNTVALLAEGSSRLDVRANAFAGNGWAVKVMANADDNVFSDNSFVANTFDVSTNSLRATSTFRSNYWDAYGGYDLDRDGTGDVPFRPVRLFSLIVERHPPALILLRGVLVQLMDAAERVLPVLTPEALIDLKPRMSAAGAGPAAAALDVRTAERVHP